MVSIATTVWCLEACCYFTNSQYIKYDAPLYKHNFLDNHFLVPFTIPTFGNKSPVTPEQGSHGDLTAS